MIGSLKSLFEKIRLFFSRKETYDDAQYQLFEKLQPGDLVFCQMPLNKKELTKINVIKLRQKELSRYSGLGSFSIYRHDKNCSIATTCLRIYNIAVSHIDS